MNNYMGQQYDAHGFDRRCVDRRHLDILSGPRENDQTSTPVRWVRQGLSSCAALEIAVNTAMSQEVVRRECWRKVECHRYVAARCHRIGAHLSSCAPPSASSHEVPPPLHFEHADHISNSVETIHLRLVQLSSRHFGAVYVMTDVMTDALPGQPSSPHASLKPPRQSL
jgi:hypothetical protein